MSTDESPTLLKYFRTREAYAYRMLAFATEQTGTNESLLESLKLYQKSHDIYAAMGKMGGALRADFDIARVNFKRDKRNKAAKGEHVEKEKQRYEILRENHCQEAYQTIAAGREYGKTLLKADYGIDAERL